MGSLLPASATVTTLKLGKNKVVLNMEMTAAQSCDQANVFFILQYTLIIFLTLAFFGFSCHMNFIINYIFN